jgi:hypothetical protein
MDTKDIKYCLDQILTADFRGAEHKRECLLRLIQPLMGAAILCEAHVTIGRPESHWVFHLLRAFKEAGIEPGKTHEEFEEEAKREHHRL